MPSPVLIDLNKVDVSLNNKRVLHSISWKLRKGEQWLFLGPNGSGKTTLLKLIRGYLWPTPGSRGKRLYYFSGETSESPIGLENKIAWVSSEQQQRYQRYEWNLSGEDIILTGFWDTDFLYEKPDVTQVNLARQLIRKLKVQQLAKKYYDQMSEGELRIILIVRALISHPEVLIVEEFCNNLDSHARGELLAMIDRMKFTGTQIIMSAHRSEDILPSITHIAVLDIGRIIKMEMLREMYKSGYFSERCPREENRKRVPLSRNRGKQQPLVCVRNADVYYHHRKILSKIDWRVMTNENWAITGPNGSGKSSLLKLVYGDFSCALGGDISHFDAHGRIVVLEARRMMGLVSSSLQHAYKEAISVERAVASGYFASIGMNERITAGQGKRVLQILNQLKIEKLAKKNVQRLSFGQIRKVLIARAMVFKPRLLLLDEPLDGLDVSTREEINIILASLAAMGTSLVMVSHHEEDFPQNITHRMRLENGRIVERRKVR